MIKIIDNPYSAQSIFEFVWNHSAESSTKHNNNKTILHTNLKSLTSLSQQMMKNPQIYYTIPFPLLTNDV